MATAQVVFERELEFFRIDAESAAQYFYAYAAVHATAARPEVRATLNVAPLFWNTTLAALQASAIISLHKVFDQTSPHNIDRLLKLASQNASHLFSREALAARKQGANATRPSWIDAYVQSAHVPTAADFRRLRAHVRKYRAIYEVSYRNLRNKFFAHRGVSDRAQLEALFAIANIEQLQRLLAFLRALYLALWNMLENGWKPLLRPQRYSAVRMRAHPTPEYHSKNVAERITVETERFLRHAASAVTAAPSGQGRKRLKRHT